MVSNTTVQGGEKKGKNINSPANTNRDVDGFLQLVISMPQQDYMSSAVTR